MEHLWTFLLLVAAILAGLTIGGMVHAGTLLSGAAAPVATV